jgi:hypothetical protein
MNRHVSPRREHGGRLFPVAFLFRARKGNRADLALSISPAEPGALRCEPLKAASMRRLVRSLLMPTSLLGLAHTNDCAQHSHPSAAIRAIFIVSIICVTVQHSN